MSVYSTQFYCGLAPEGTAGLYTVPADRTLVVRDVEIYNSTAGPVLFQLFTTGPGGNIQIYTDLALPAEKSVQWQGRTVLNGGQQLASSAGAAGVQLIVSGYLLDP